METPTEVPHFGDYVWVACLTYLWTWLLLAAVAAIAALVAGSRLGATLAAAFVSLLAYFLPVEWFRDMSAPLNAGTVLMWGWAIVLMLTVAALVRAWCFAARTDRQDAIPPSS